MGFSRMAAGDLALYLFSLVFFIGGFGFSLYLIPEATIAERIAAILFTGGLFFAMTLGFFLTGTWTLRKTKG